VFRHGGSILAAAVAANISDLAALFRRHPPGAAHAAGEFGDEVDHDGDRFRFSPAAAKAVRMVARLDRSPEGVRRDLISDKLFYRRGFWGRSGSMHS
jgi:hypothetical protein